MEESKRTFWIGCVTGLAAGFCLFQNWFAGIFCFLVAVLIDELTKKRNDEETLKEVLREEEQWKQNN